MPSITYSGHIRLSTQQCSSFQSVHLFERPEHFLTEPWITAELQLK